MSSNGSAKIKPVEGTKIRILDKGELLELEYDGAMCRHPGSLWWGTAVGYRAMQAAAEALSQERLWDRENLYVVTGHPGPGVQDAITYVTNVVERGRFHSVIAEGCGMHCNSKMKFDWWVSDGEKTAVIKLRRDFVPREFYELSDRLGTPATTKEDIRYFNISKVNLSTKIWVAPLEENFSVEFLEKPLQPGDLPAEINDKYFDDALPAVY